MRRVCEIVLRWGALATGLALGVSLMLIPGAFASTGANLIAFVRDSNIWVLDPDGNPPIRLTSDGASLWPTQSPDGRIAYVSAPKRGQTDLWVIVGTSRTRLTDDPHVERSPEWSPVANSIVFFSSRDGYAQLYTVDTDTGHQDQLTHSPWHHVDPTWSPDGQWIAFGAPAPSGHGYAIWVMSVHPREESLLYVHGDSVSDLAWSPDGKKIAFASNADIWTIDVAPGAFGWIAQGQSARNLTRTSTGERWPSWAPDGRIAFMTDRDGNNEIYAMNADGTAPQNLTTSRRTDDVYPAWSR